MICFKIRIQRIFVFVILCLSVMACSYFSPINIVILMFVDSQSSGDMSIIEDSTEEEKVITVEE